MSDRPTARSLLLTATLLALSALLAPSTASGQDLLHWSAGGKLGVAANLLTPPAIVAEPNPPVPAFLGAGGGAGAAVEVLYGDYVGLGVELWRVTSRGRGRYTFVSRTGAYSVDQQLRSDDFQIPLLLTAKLPLRYVQPFLAVGPTFVIQTDTGYSVDPEVATEIVAPEPASYTALTGALGANIQVRDFGLPIELRATWLPLDRDPRARAEYDYYQEGGDGFLTRMSIHARWEAQLWVMVGVQYRGVVDPW